MRLLLWLLSVILLFIAPFGCTSAGKDVEQAIAELEGPHVEINILNIDPGGNLDLDSEFQPDSVTISPGTTVFWINNDSGPHSVTEGVPENAEHAFDEEIPPGSYFMHTFEEPGAFSYFCRYHESEVGEIIIQ